MIYIAFKDCKRLLKQLEKLEVFLLAKHLGKLPGEGSFHCLLNRDRLRKSFKRGPWRVHWPGRCHMQADGGRGPTSLSLHETMLLDVQDTKIPDTPMDATSNIHKQLGIS
ncbi:PREDICTED: putative uncharacterized protein C5orf60 [Rhinopithecus bieti]|uniref:putative uncharacterized protein C5orf60 n=1 Tax=Rhinopithecus bieti TaxID=61621 RepID=UPI00083C1BF9|nr:PREDICTED: putative uncharacterized protein C5orf60 [Rhinopithecus bieti]